MEEKGDAGQAARTKTRRVGYHNKGSRLTISRMVVVLNIKLSMCEVDRKRGDSSIESRSSFVDLKVDGSGG
jgi:hypothetical protein